MSYPYIQAKYFSGYRDTAVNALVIHCTVSGHGSAYGIARNVFASPTANQASAEWVIDGPNGVIQCTPLDGTSWHCGHWWTNTRSEAFEFCGMPGWSREEWLADDCIENGARLMAERIQARGISFRRIQGAQIVNGESGIFTHLDVTQAFSVYGGHTDPGPGFPMDVLFDRIGAYLDGAVYEEAAVAVPTVVIPTDANLDALANAVIRGEYGTGDARRAALGDNYAAVQNLVNYKLGVTSIKTDIVPTYTPPTKSVDEDINDLADRVLNGEFGNGEDRRNALGDKFDAVQAIVNARLGYAVISTAPVVRPAATNLDDLVNRTLAGEFGNGEDRRNALGANYDAVQDAINARFGIGPVSYNEPVADTVDINALADAVIRGEYGVGDDRRAALGDNYDAVQALVNQKLGY